jgi:hypothetical protein
VRLPGRTTGSGKLTKSCLSNVVYFFRCGGKPAVVIACVVGTILSLVNQTDVLFSLQLETKDVFRIGMNYTIPLLVSTYSRYNLKVSANQ